MAKEFDNTNRGAFWKNKNKEADAHPDWSGSLNTCCPNCGSGTDWWLSGWTKKKDASAKAPLLSFAVKPKDEEKTAKPRTRAQKNDEMADEIPF